MRISVFSCDGMLSAFKILGLQGASRAHLLFQLWKFSLCVHCKTITKSFRRFKNRGFLKFIDDRILLETNFKIIFIYFEVTHKIWARSVQPFDVYWIQIDRQTNRQASSIYIGGRSGMFFKLFYITTRFFSCIQSWQCPIYNGFLESLFKYELNIQVFLTVKDTIGNQTIAIFAWRVT